MSLRTAFLTLTAFALIAALTARFGTPIGVMATAVFGFAALLSWGASGEPGTCASFLLPLVLLLTFGDYALPVFVDLPSCLAACGLVALACGPFLRSEGNRSIWIMALIACIWLSSLTLINATPQKAFVRAYHRIHKGMTVEEVVGAINNQFDGDAPRVNHRQDRLTVILDPNDGRYNAELIQVRFINGRVASKRYLPD